MYTGLRQSANLLMQRLFQVFLVLVLASSPGIALPTQRPELLAVRVRQPNIIIRGAYLSRVEIWTVASGTETSSEGQRVGNAKRSTAPGAIEIWSFKIVCESPLVPSIQVFVKAFDETGKLVGRKSLPYAGVTEVARALRC